MHSLTNAIVLLNKSLMSNNRWSFTRMSLFSTYKKWLFVSCAYQQVRHWHTLYIHIYIWYRDNKTTPFIYANGVRRSTDSRLHKPLHRHTRQSEACSQLQLEATSANVEKCVKKRRRESNADVINVLWSSCSAGVAAKGYSAAVFKEFGRHLDQRDT